MKLPIRQLSNLLSTLLCAGIVLSPLLSFGAQDKILVTGTGSAVEVMALMAKAFHKKHPETTVVILPSVGSSGGIKGVRDRKIDVGLSARTMKQEEKTPGLVEELYGRTAFLFAVPTANPLKGLTLQEIENIYSGKTTTWQNGDQIRLILRPQSDSYSLLLAGISPGMKAASDKSHTIPGVFVGATDQDAAAQIERTQGSFGVTSACLVVAEKRKVKGLPVNGKAPTVANVASGAYPFFMNMYVLYRTDSANPSVKLFIDFIYSDQGRKILTQTEHVVERRGPVR
jgi:phosphate transport system substrate-binding protein